VGGVREERNGAEGEARGCLDEYLDRVSEGVDDTRAGEAAPCGLGVESGFSDRPIAHRGLYRNPSDKSSD